MWSDGGQLLRILANALGFVVVCTDGACSSRALPEHFAQEACSRGF